MTDLQMQLYLVVADFRRRRNKRGGEYGMPVSILLPPEAVWGYDAVAAACSESPEDSSRRIAEQICRHWPSAKKKGFLADPKFLKHKGFRVADEADCGIQLWYLPLRDGEEPPRFKDCRLSVR